jgi:PLP dependent protein
VTQITDHLAIIRERVAGALRRSNRDGDHVIIVAVSKQQSVDCITAAFKAGQRCFGESYVQEALAKMAVLGSLPIEWHFIGPIQANKTRPIAERFQWVHTVDRARIAERLNAQRPSHAPPLNVLIQVNLAREPQKAGVAEAALADLVDVVAALPRLRFRGLMGIPPARGTTADNAAFYSRLRELQTGLARDGTDTLSMGMSGDFETAIENGSTCVRIGTAIFEARPG